MLEILAIYYLAKRNAEVVADKGRKKGMFIALTIILWVGMEIFGAILGAILDISAGAYILTLGAALLGGFISTKIADGAAPGNYFTPEKLMEKEILATAQPLAQPASINLIREKSFLASLVKYEFTLNGTPVALLKNGEQTVFQTNFRQNVLVGKANGNKTKPMMFDILDGGSGVVVFKGTDFLPTRTQGLLPISRPMAQQSYQPESAPAVM